MEIPELVAPQETADNASAWSRRCRVCGRRLRVGEENGAVCSRTSCNDAAGVDFPLAVAVTYGADGPEAS